VKIRPVRQSDFEQWLPLWDGYNAFYGRAGATALLVAEDGRELVGLVHYLFHRSTTMVALTCYLQDLFTAPARRGQGIGKSLIEAVYAQARGTGAGRVYWLTHGTNKTARRLYDQVAEDSGFLVYRKQID
jgi:GNAT superfamily N-acetyltransferase